MGKQYKKDYDRKILNESHTVIGNNKEMKYLELEDIKKVALDILKRVTKICDDNGFRYVLAYGTLIGAIRHQGFIPWDDDIDIQMPRPDYEKFLKFMDAHETELGNLRVFTRKNTKNYFYGIARVCNTDYEIHTHNEKDCGMGLFIDVYPFDGLGSSYSKAFEFIRKMSIINDKLVAASLISVEYNRHLKYDLELLLTRILGKKHFFNKVDKIVSKCNFNESNYLGLAGWCGMPLIYNKNLFEDRIKVKFEDTEFYAPKEYDYILRMTYGDYMKLPPKSEQVPHHGYVAFKKIR